MNSKTIDTGRKAFFTRGAVLVVAAVASLALVTEAQAQRHGSRGGGGHHGYHGSGGHGYHGGGGHYAPRGGYYRGGGGPGWVLGGIGLGLGLGIASYYNSYPYAYEPYGYGTSPGYVVVDSPVVYASPQPVYSAPVPARGAAPQPVVYPRNGQGAAQIDADGDACSQWAGKQPNATSDRSVFQRGISACMDARGYTLR